MPTDTVTVSDTTLFHVAASVLGDATAWNRIAAVNALSDPMLNGTVTLVLPVGIAAGVASGSVA